MGYGRQILAVYAQLGPFRQAHVRQDGVSRGSETQHAQAALDVVEGDTLLFGAGEPNPPGYLFGVGHQALGRDGANDLLLDLIEFSHPLLLAIAVRL
jgi:hypothetical protein